MCFSVSSKPCAVSQSQASVTLEVFTCGIFLFPTPPLLITGIGESNVQLTRVCNRPMRVVFKSQTFCAASHSGGHESWIPQRQESSFCWLLCLKHPEHYLEPKRYSITMCGMNDNVASTVVVFPLCVCTFRKIFAWILTWGPWTQMYFTKP